MSACDAHRDSCWCDLAAGHEGPHVCECKGSWADDGTVHAWPEVYVGPPGGRAGYEAVMPLLRELTGMLPLPGPAYSQDSEPK